MRAQLQVQNGEERHEQRRFAHRDAEIEPVGADGVPGIVTDISPSGFRIVLDEPLAAESVVWLTVGDEGPFMARVVWYDGTAAGCAFAGRLRPDVVSRLLRG